MTVSRVIQSALTALTKHFVPFNVSFNHVSRHLVIEQYSRPLAKMILANNDNNVTILILDGTYVYVQKSINNSLQGKVYCVHKGRSVVKMMMVVTTTGYIVSVLGPYYSDSKNNDSMMTKHILYKNREEVRDCLQKGDILITYNGVCWFQSEFREEKLNLISNWILGVGHGATNGGDRQRVSEDGGQKAHTKLRVPTHSPPPPGLPTSISKKWGGGV